MEIKRFAVELTMDENQLLSKLAKSIGRTKKAQVEWLIREFLNKNKESKD